MVRRSPANRTGTGAIWPFVNDMEGGGKGQKYIELAKFLLDSRYTAAVIPRETGRSMTKVTCRLLNNMRQ